MLQGILFTIVVLFIAFLSFLFWRAKRIALYELQERGLAKISSVKLLIGLLQKHRGLSAAKCQGDQSVGGDLSVIKQQVAKLMSSKSLIHEDSERWQSFHDHWQRLANDKTTVTAENSFQQHTQLISNLIYLLEDVAQLHKLSAHYLPEFAYIDFVWRELVNVTESVGQSRAVGTASVTMGHCDSVQLIRLKFLTKHINTISAQVLSKITSKNRRTKTMLEAGLSKTRSLTSVIEQEIIDRERIAISRDEYFSQATETMTSLNTIFDAQVEEIKKSIAA
ncbi:nitrate- and nitrite sensing domain-containing protein [Thalassotalea euphylliae]|uniref:nitrate- and nitrite sensing domain-containing protein n=1 Tax=Thalassotalea euphylliae TaxID=1655234 RepID=UPI00363B5CAB